MNLRVATKTIASTFNRIHRIRVARNEAELPTLSYGLVFRFQLLDQALIKAIIIGNAADPDAQQVVQVSAHTESADDLRHARDRTADR